MGINYIIHGYGQSGVQNEGDYEYVIHNTIYNNSMATCDTQRCGVSVFTAKALSGYSRLKNQ